MRQLGPCRRSSSRRILSGMVAIDGTTEHLTTCWWAIVRQHFLGELVDFGVTIKYLGTGRASVLLRSRRLRCWDKRPSLNWRALLVCRVSRSAALGGLLVVRRHVRVWWWQILGERSSVVRLAAWWLREVFWLALWIGRGRDLGRSDMDLVLKRVLALIYRKLWAVEHLRWRLRLCQLFWGVHGVIHDC